MNTLVLATPLYPPEIGGPATDVAMLEKGLPAHGFETVIVAFSHVRHLPPGVRHARYMYEVYKKSRGADAIVAFDTFSVAVPAFVAAWMRRMPFAIRVPGDYAWEQGKQRFGVSDTIEVFQRRRYGFRIEMIRALQCFVVRRAALVMVPSDYFKRIVETWGVRPERLVRTYLGGDANTNSITSESAPQDKIIVSIGRLVPWKGFAMLIDLMRDLPKEWHLVVIGDGPDRTLLENKAREIGVAPRLTFTGSLEHTAVRGWLAHADVFALNTSFESFSFQVLEAMEAGIPVITTSIGSLPELVENGAEGVLCTPNDADAFRAAIESVVSDRTVWQRRTQAAQQKAKQFSSENAVRAFAQAIKSICI